MGGIKKNSKKFVHNRNLKSGKDKIRFTSDFYVPIELYSYVIKRIQKEKNLAFYLKRLLKDQRLKILRNQTPHNKERTSYQLKFQGLIRLSFRPNENDWAELRSLARYLGTSMCKAFVLLMDLEKQQLPNKESSKNGLFKTKFRITSLLQKFSREKRYITFELILDS
ncbi:DUF1564 family protein [Leptospira barantonii]|uniref:DUF1564 family protein n=1 Tax=Leptospira barantonii TaxID=2023184 RepID=A0A5F2BBZ0_9LEPT|nr:DUF1564 family protein [Leptospira barantonii]